MTNSTLLPSTVVYLVREAGRRQLKLKEKEVGGRVSVLLGNVLSYLEIANIILLSLFILMHLAVYTTNCNEFQSSQGTRFFQDTKTPSAASCGPKITSSDYSKWMDRCCIGKSKWTIVSFGLNLTDLVYGIT